MGFMFLFVTVRVIVNLQSISGLVFFLHTLQIIYILYYIHQLDFPFRRNIMLKLYLLLLKNIKIKTFDNPYIFLTFNIFNLIFIMHLFIKKS